MTLGTVYGDTSVYRFLVLPGPTEVRPANFDSAALTLPELTTSDMPVAVATVARDTPIMYGTPPAGSAGVTSWARPRPGQGSWTVTLTGNVQPTETEREAMEALYAARGRYVWTERRMATDDKNEGGCALVTSTGKPIPADGPVTFTSGLTGYGRHFPDTALAV
ncbi:hypothetical protein DAETH_28940 [Deinococcus aetherius]|uniref:Uncharacterized protein n=1 Tax=Deinococcus aetherius TaxID=200252 RepID=A0ABM8AGX9_9DEIO|nr:hypothetical protein [Deinococcus aetherius]BDP42925.1 hypothetical protein DAETH_28940 [Deinococcus aetherius]